MLSKQLCTVKGVDKELLRVSWSGFWDDSNRSFGPGWLVGWFADWSHFLQMPSDPIRLVSGKFGNPLAAV